MKGMSHSHIRKSFKLAFPYLGIMDPQQVEIFEEEGQTYLRCEDIYYDTEDPEAQRTFNVVEASGPGSYHGIAFEEI